MDALSDQYNARGLAPDVVAATFVAPAQFVEISAERNTVLVGSRGSGKTTLLRMLDPRAQLAWMRNGGTDRVIAPVGIFVPMDASWLASLRSTCFSPTDWGRVALAVYSLTMLRAAVDCMIYRLKSSEDANSPYSASVAFESEASLVEELERVLFLKLGCKTLVALRFRLTAFVAAFPRHISELGEDEREGVLVHLADPVRLAAAACELFNLVVEEPQRHWILLCDELEIAPPEIQEALLLALRAPPSILYLKLAMTPVVRALGSQMVEQPLPAHDFDVVSLSYSTREEGLDNRSREKFCQSIWRQLADYMYPGHGGVLHNPYKVFEEPDVAVAVRRRGMRALPTQAERGAERHASMFQRLAEVDPSFQQYLQRKNVDPSQIAACPPEVMDAVVRKVAPLVEVRLFFRATAGGRQSRASRRSSAIYTGAKRIFDISEGHPRWLKANIGRMLSRVNDRGRIALEVQATELAKSVERLNARVAALPSPYSRPASAQELIQAIGEFFSAQVLGDEFISDPYLSFLVDDGCPKEVVQSLEDALYIGALVPMAREAGGLLQDGLLGKRLRLSYWLAPRFKLPLLTGKPIPLTSLLSAVRDGTYVRLPQLDLQVRR